MQWKPNVTVAAIAQHKNKFLVVEEEENKQIVFNQPAGHLEKNETFIEAVTREVLEETAWEFRPESLTGIYLYHNTVVNITYLRVCFYGTCLQHYPDRVLDTGILGTHWLDRQELEAIRDRLRSKMVLRCIDDFLAGNRYPLEILNYYL